ncbi:rhodanese-like domain-containing protein [Frankia sp. Mgl5]|uniref:rhodanese-like domain-containing protein n=1 Tax=Frankiaceae TaxID=74712 RepID=UPI00005451D4|nr:rhodanese-like domain-containing protein [Frankia sp. Mgl5]ABW09616.1 Rhodanese domain protein [Frankia sp. EAN1pec]MCK9932973.1 rhodanese-like domain-containing protein [Frankia sp. Mgl5]
MSPQQIPTVNVTELPVHLPAEGGPLLVDVREPDEWAAGHIDGAVHIPMGDFLARISEVPREREIVVVCRSGSRSAAVTAHLAREGWQARNLVDGMIGWQAAGRPMISETPLAPTVL